MEGVIAYRKNVINSIIKLTYEIEKLKRGQALTKETERQILKKARMWEDKKFRDFNNQISEGYLNTVRTKVKVLKTEFERRRLEARERQNQRSSQSAYPPSQRSGQYGQYAQAQQGQAQGQAQAQRSHHAQGHSHNRPITTYHRERDNYQYPQQNQYTQQPQQRHNTQATNGGSYTNNYEHESQFYRLRDKIRQYIPSMERDIQILEDKYFAVREEALRDPSRKASAEKYKLNLNKYRSYKRFIESSSPPKNFPKGIHTLNSIFGEWRELHKKIQYNQRRLPEQQQYGRSQNGNRNNYGSYQEPNYNHQRDYQSGTSIPRDHSNYQGRDQIYSRQPINYGQTQRNQGHYQEDYSHAPSPAPIMSRDARSSPIIHRQSSPTNYQGRSEAPSRLRGTYSSASNSHQQQHQQFRPISPNINYSRQPSRSSYRIPHGHSQQTIPVQSRAHHPPQSPIRRHQPQIHAPIHAQSDRMTLQPSPITPSVPSPRQRPVSKRRPNPSPVPMKKKPTAKKSNLPKNTPVRARQIIKESQIGKRKLQETIEANAVLQNPKRQRLVPVTSPITVAAKKASRKFAGKDLSVLMRKEGTGSTPPNSNAQQNSKPKEVEIVEIEKAPEKTGPRVIASSKSTPEQNLKVGEPQQSKVTISPDSKSNASQNTKTKPIESKSVLVEFLKEYEKKPKAERKPLRWDKASEIASQVLVGFDALF